MPLIHRRSILGRFGVRPAHVPALFRVPVVVHPGEMVDVRLRVDPDNGVIRAMSACRLSQT